MPVALASLVRVTDVREVDITTSIFSALTVRLLTNRFITTYEPNSPTMTSTKRQSVDAGASLGFQDLVLMVRDVSPLDQDLKSHLAWGKVHIVLCARNDARSLEYAKRVVDLHSKGSFGPLILVANKVRRF